MTDVQDAVAAHVRPTVRTSSRTNLGRSGWARAASPPAWSSAWSALVVVLVFAIGAGTYFALRSFLGDRLDQQLQDTAERLDSACCSATSRRS